MKRIRRYTGWLVCAALLVSLLSGCGKSDETVEPFMLSVSTCGALETLDPAMVSGVGEESLLATLFEGLMKMRDDGNGKAVATAGMAREYTEEQNYDGTVTYTFTLRSTARWSDGTRVKAEDFVYAWQRLADPATGSPNAELLRLVKGYAEVTPGDTSALAVSAKGDNTFIVTLSEPSAYFISSVCTAPATAPLRREIVEGNEEWAKSADLVTNGPYCVETWIKASSLQTKRNEEYYETKLVVPDTLRFVLDGDVESNYQKLLSGELDYVSQLPYAEIEVMAEQEDWQPEPLAETSCVLYNHLTDAFSNKQIRQAFEFAIDRVSLAEQIGVTAVAATGCVPYGISNAPESENDFRTTGGELCITETEEYAARCAEASRLMTGEGHYQGAGLGTLRFVFVEGEENRAAAQALKTMWRTALGADVELVGVSAEEYTQRLETGEYELALTTLTARCDDAMEYLQPFWGTSQSNVCGYRNDTFDLLLGVAETTGDLNARAAFLHDAEAMMLEDYAVSPLYFCGTAYLLRAEYRGVSHDCFGHSYFTSASKAESAG